ncbi:predicted protein [Postia placenta Mad-698-R]|uniref:F-box domain-containing protein n=1 Tax=Postia placenta MAD-698-R-SB12 TaxID=670580 RepID=A0A1X6MMV8_9APHY|nr:hypothetical protein POSPLADRAFT_1049817 [Postia placenta MAD-698-R-SB12]EED80119.1 predicted protein [Postia placenta Mad-698-R]OSX57576.1 hypothetical protein POSPLADRAFT_1049817 [Postia placenta MAD-698-R-SB12]
MSQTIDDYTDTIDLTFDANLRTPAEARMFCDDMKREGYTRTPYLKELRLSADACWNIDVGLLSDLLFSTCNLRLLRLAHSEALFQKDLSLSKNIASLHTLTTLELYDGGLHTIEMFTTMRSKLLRVVHITDRNDPTHRVYNYAPFFSCGAIRGLKTLVLDSLKCDDKTFGSEGRKLKFKSVESLTLSRSKVPMNVFVKAFPCIKSLILAEVTPSIEYRWPYLCSLAVDLLSCWPIAFNVDHLMITRLDTAESRGLIEPILQAVKHMMPHVLTLSPQSDIEDEFWNGLKVSVPSVVALQIRFDDVLAVNARTLGNRLVWAAQAPHPSVHARATGSRVFTRIHEHALSLEYLVFEVFEGRYMNTGVNSAIFTHRLQVTRDISGGKQITELTSANDSVLLQEVLRDVDCDAPEW